MKYIVHLMTPVCTWEVEAEDEGEAIRKCPAPPEFGGYAVYWTEPYAHYHRRITEQPKTESAGYES